MIENKTNNLDALNKTPGTGSAGDAITAPAVTPAKAAVTPEPPMSPGEKWFNRIVYNWLNYWVNLGGSVVIADVAISGAGRKPLLWSIGKVAQGLSRIGIPLKTAHHQARVGLETLSLMSGGWILLWPMKSLEDNKRSWVHWLNKKMGVSQCGPDGKELTPEQIHIVEEREPQTWWNVIRRRLIATATVVGSGMLLDHLAADKSKSQHHEYPLNPYVPGSQIISHEGHMGGKEWATNKIVGGVNWGLGFIPGSKQIFGGQRMQRWMGLTALDTIFTKMTSVTMYLTRGTHQEKMKDEVYENTAAPASPPESAQPSAPVPDKKPLAEKIRRPETKPLAASSSYTDMVRQGEQNLTLTP